MKIGKRRWTAAPTILLTVGSRPMGFELVYDVCTNPDCDCNLVRIGLVNRQGVLRFFLNLKTGRYNEGDYTNEEREIISAFLDFVRFPKNDYYNLDFFRRVYEATKLRERTRKETIDAYRPGKFMTYIDVFGHSEIITMGMGNQEYEVTDAYCVNPGCGCTDVSLAFFKKTDKGGVRDPEFSFLYGYSDGSFQRPVNIGPDKVRDIMKQFDAKANNAFRRRHKKLKKEVKPHIKKKNSEQGGKVNGKAEA